MLRSDIDEQCDSESARDCWINKCPEYDICDNCGRRVCKYVSVVIANEDRGEEEDDGELWCRYCCKRRSFSNSEIASGRVYL